MESKFAGSSFPNTGGSTLHTESMHRHWSDWAGCLLWLALVADTLTHSPQIGILLLPTVFHELIVAFSFLVRRPLSRQSRGWRPRVAAYSGTFLVLAFIRFASAFRPDWVEVSQFRILTGLGMAMWLLGTVFGLYCIWYFRHAFSIVPQARVLVTSGPFRVARHPIYLAYFLQYLGIWFTHLTSQLGVVLLLWAVIMLLRIKYEETLLLAAFPEYADYRRQVRAIYPTLPRPMVGDRPRSISKIDA
jgi:protein-S-isoprenylcysteine O-methyltransferase Ste14